VNGLPGLKLGGQDPGHVEGGLVKVGPMDDHPFVDVVLSGPHHFAFFDWGPEGVGRGRDGHVFENDGLNDHPLRLGGFMPVGNFTEPRPQR